MEEVNGTLYSFSFEYNNATVIIDLDNVAWEAKIDYGVTPKELFVDADMKYLFIHSTLSKPINTMLLAYSIPKGNLIVNQTQYPTFSMNAKLTINTIDKQFIVVDNDWV